MELSGRTKTMHLHLLVSSLCLGAALARDPFQCCPSFPPTLLSCLSVLWLAPKHKCIFFLHSPRLLLGYRGEQMTVMS